MSSKRWYFYLHMGNDVLLPLIIFGGFVALAAFAIRHKCQIDEEILRRASGLINGKLHKTLLFPKLLIPSEGRTIELYFVTGNKNSPEKTVCKIPMSISRRHTLHVRQELPSIPLLKSLIRDVEVGNPEFDGKFLVQSNSESLAKILLDSEVQSLLLRYLALFQRHPSLNIMNKSLFLQLNHREVDPDKLAELVKGAALLARRAPGIESTFRN